MTTVDDDLFNRYGMWGGTWRMILTVALIPFMIVGFLLSACFAAVCTGWEAFEETE